MNCDQCRKEYHAWLDAGRSSPLPVEVETHVRACADCSSFAASMLMIDRELRASPGVPVPPRLLASLKSIAAYESAAYARKRDIVFARRILVLALLVVLLWVVSAQLPLTWDAVLRTVVLAAGFFSLTLSSLRPRFF